MKIAKRLFSEGRRYGNNMQHQVVLSRTNTQLLTTHVLRVERHSIKLYQDLHRPYLCLLMTARKCGQPEFPLRGGMGDARNVST
jgi:hypothetical protein